VSVSAAGGGGFYRDDQGLPDLGVDTELRIEAPSTNGNNGINKYSVYNYLATNPLARTGYMRTSFRLGNSTGGNADIGTFYFFWGNGTSFENNNNAYVNDPAAVGMRFLLGSNGSVNTSWMVNGGWVSFNDSLTFVQGQTYLLEFFASNGNGLGQGNPYTCNGISDTVGSPYVDLWVNGIREANEMAQATVLGNNKAFDSFMWYGQDSGGNVANLFLDSMVWSNDLGTTFTTTYYDFYSKPNVDLSVLTNWGSNQDGSGAAPLSFATADQTFHIRNNPSPTIGANWTVSGTNSGVILGDGENACTFTVPSNFTMTGTIDVNNLGILNLQNTTHPTFGMLYQGSTVRYSSTGTQTVTGTTYYDLSIQGTGTKTLGGTTSATNKVYVGDGTNTVTLTVPSTYALTGSVDVNAYGILDLQHYSLPTLGTLAANSTVRYNYAGDQQVTGTTYYNLDVDNGFTKTMQNDVAVTTLSFANAGTLALNSYDLTLTGKDISFYSTNAVFSALNVATGNAIINGVSLGPYWETSATFTNTVDATFRYSTTLSTDTTISLWYYGDSAVWTYYGDLTATDGADGYMYVTVTGLTTLGTGAKGPIKWTFAPLDETLPVELSSFTAAISSQNYVMLQWVTQSETNVVGYRIYRNTIPELETAEMLNAIVEATNTSTMQVYVFWDNEIYENGTYYYWLQNLDFSGESAFHGPVSISVSLDSYGTPTIPIVQGINNAYPNPFNPSTTIEFGVVRPGNVTVAVYNQRGQLIRNLYNGARDTGTYFLTWDGTDANNRPLASGIYYIRMDANGTQSFRKVMLMK
jgi:hypothetical protein